MKKLLSVLLCITLLASCTLSSQKEANTSALAEQDHTELNQRQLLVNQPLPNITWSMERDNLIKFKKLQNDRTVNFYMYVFIEGVGQPIGYYQVNKVSSVNSQLSNPEQIVTYSSPNHSDGWGQHVISSPSEDGSYGTNGESVFGFTPDEVCIQTNMKFITATVPLSFKEPVNKLAVITTDDARKILDASKKAMGIK